MKAFGGNNCSGSIDVATALASNEQGSGYRLDFESDTLLATLDPKRDLAPHGSVEPRQVAATLTETDHKDPQIVCLTGEVAHSLRADGFDASEDGTGRGTPIIPLGVQTANASMNGPIHREDVAWPVETSPTRTAVLAPTYVQDVADPISAHEQGTYTHEGEHNFRTRNVTVFDTTQVTHPENRCNPQPGDPCHPLAAHGHPPAVAFQPRFARNGRGAPDEVASSLTAEPGRTGKGDSAQCIAFQERGRAEGRAVEVGGEVAYALNAGEGGGRGQERNVAIGGPTWAVRRLTPEECEKLMGLPPGYTRIPFRGKPMADGPRYKMLGNSMAVNCMRWIGQRIAMVEAIPGEDEYREAAE